MKVQVVTSTKTYEVPEGLLPKVEQNNSEKVLRVNLSDTEELVCYNLQVYELKDGVLSYYCVPSNIIYEEGKPLEYKIQSLLGMG